MARANATASRADHVSKARPTTRSAGSASRVGAVPRKRGVDPRTSRPSSRKITTRTAKDRAARSPIAQVVNRRDAPARLRRFVFMAVGVAIAAITLMMLVVVFQTRLAATQLGIDDIEAQITTERNRYDELRLERSVLKEPSRLVAEAQALGMVPGSKTDFRTVDPLVVAEVLVSTGDVDPNSVLSIKDSLERYGSVKSLIGGGR